MAAEISLGDPIGEDKEGNKILLFDVIPSEEPDVAQTVETKMQIERLNKIMQKILTRREQLVLEMRYGLCGHHPLPQREIAEKLAISRSYVSRIEKKALQKLTRALEKRE